MRSVDADDIPSARSFELRLQHYGVVFVPRYGCPGVCMIIIIHNLDAWLFGNLSYSFN